MAMRLSVIGLGRLGAPIAACLAARGFQVTGVDADARRVEAVNGRVPPVFEPGLDEMLRAAGERLTATTDIDAAVDASQASFIVVPTPSEPEGGFSLGHVLEAAEAIGRSLGRRRAVGSGSPSAAAQAGAERLAPPISTAARSECGAPTSAAHPDYHLVVLTSTVTPGATDGEVVRALERASGRRCGRDFGLCYSPEFVALGSVIRDFLNPDFVLIGEWDARSGDMLEGIYKEVCYKTPSVARMNPVNAELTKLALNTFVTTKITFANTIARICERVPGADADVVTGALALDSRIGGKYLKGAVGYGGPCFPRDNMALSFLARRLGAPATLAEATDEVNRRQNAYVTEIVKSKLPPEGTAGVLGLTYKPKTDVVEESPGSLLVRSLLGDGVSVIGYDPSGTEKARAELGRGVRLASSVDECIAQSDVIVITTPWEEFRGITPRSLERSGARRVLIDCWRLLDKPEYREVVDYVPLGVGARRQTGTADERR